jgi:hypothetical protein
MSYADQDIKTRSKFLKIEQNAPMVVRLLDATPVEVMKHQLKQANADGKFQIECQGEDICPLCQDGDEATQKFIANVYNHTLSKVQLWEYGPSIAKMIKKVAINLAEEEQDIMNFDLKVEAEGAGLNKKYTVTMRTTPQPVPAGLQLIKIEPGIPF